MSTEDSKQSRVRRKYPEPNPQAAYYTTCITFLRRVQAFSVDATLETGSQLFFPENESVGRILFDNGADSVQRVIGRKGTGKTALYNYLTSARFQDDISRDTTGLKSKTLVVPMSEEIDLVFNHNIDLTTRAIASNQFGVSNYVNMWEAMIYLKTAQVMIANNTLQLLLTSSQKRDLVSFIEKIKQHVKLSNDEHLALLSPRALELLGDVPWLEAKESLNRLFTEIQALSNFNIWVVIDGLDQIRPSVDAMDLETTEIQTRFLVTACLYELLIRQTTQSNRSFETRSVAAGPRRRLTIFVRSDIDEFIKERQSYFNGWQILQANHQMVRELTLKWDDRELRELVNFRASREIESPTEFHPESFTGVREGSIDFVNVLFGPDLANNAREWHWGRVLGNLRDFNPECRVLPRRLNVLLNKALDIAGPGWFKEFQREDKKNRPLRPMGMLNAYLDQAFLESRKLFLEETRQEILDERIAQALLALTQLANQAVQADGRRPTFTLPEAAVIAAGYQGEIGVLVEKGIFQRRETGGGPIYRLAPYLQNRSATGTELQEIERNRRPDAV